MTAARKRSKAFIAKVTDGGGPAAESELGDAMTPEQITSRNEKIRRTWRRSAEVSSSA